MGWATFLLLLAWPAVELAVFLGIADRLGWMAALGGLLLGLMAGSLVIRRHGLAAFGRAQSVLAAGRMPVDDLFDGFCLTAAGLLLILPGFVSDLLGLALLLPPLRRALGRWAGRRLRPAAAAAPHPAASHADARFGGWPLGADPMEGAGSPDPGGGPIIEGEWEERPDPSPPPARPLPPPPARSPP